MQEVCATSSSAVSWGCVGGEAVRGPVTAGSGRAVLGRHDGSERREGDEMGQHSIRQQGWAALDAQSKRLREHAEREKRLEDWRWRVLVACSSGNWRSPLPTAEEGRSCLAWVRSS